MAPNITPHPRENWKDFLILSKTIFSLQLFQLIICTEWKLKKKWTIKITTTMTLNF